MFWIMREKKDNHWYVIRPCSSLTLTINAYRIIYKWSVVDSNIYSGTFFI